MPRSLHISTEYPCYNEWEADIKRKKDVGRADHFFYILQIKNKDIRTVSLKHIVWILMTSGNLSSGYEIQRKLKMHWNREYSFYIHITGTGLKIQLMENILK